MSGGSLGYLYNAELSDLLNRIPDLESVETTCILLGFKDVAMDVRRLIEYCISANVRIQVLFEQLQKVFHDVEWYHSSDIGKEDLLKTLEKYRGAGK